MKKTYLALIAFLFFSLSLFAQESELIEELPADKRLYFGAGWSNLQSTGDFLGSLDFGFLLYKNEAKNFNIRNSLLFDGGVLNYSGTDYGFFSLSDKIIMESMSDNNLFRYYSFLQGGIGIYGNENKNVFELPLAYNFGFGFGIDVFIKKNISLFFEETFLFNVLDNNFSIEESLNPKFQMGI